MSDRIQKAAEYHKSGMNCAQSVVCAYCDLFGADYDTAYKMSELLLHYIIPKRK